MNLDTIRTNVRQAIEELLQVARLRPGALLVVGCSTSEVCGQRIGTASAPEVAMVLFDEIVKATAAQGIYVAIQCCEHLNRALVVERAAVPASAICNAVPQLHAGGALATEAYARFNDPVVVEEIAGDAGIDIGDTFIGMHLRPVVVPVRLSITTIGAAHVTAARVRPKYIGGARAVYDSTIM